MIFFLKNTLVDRGESKIAVFFNKTVFSQTGQKNLKLCRLSLCMNVQHYISGQNGGWSSFRESEHVEFC